MLAVDLGCAWKLDVAGLHDLRLRDPQGKYVPQDARLPRIVRTLLNREIKRWAEFWTSARLAVTQALRHESVWGPCHAQYVRDALHRKAQCVRDALHRKCADNDTYTLRFNWAVQCHLSSMVLSIDYLDEEAVVRSAYVRWSLEEQCFVRVTGDCIPLDRLFPGSTPRAPFLLLTNPIDHQDIIAAWARHFIEWKIVPTQELWTGLASTGLFCYLRQTYPPPTV